VFRRLLSTSPMMPLPRDDGEAVAFLLTVLSFNTNKRAELGGLHAILKETKPHLVFLQEVFSYNAFSALASLFGYNLKASTLRQVQRDLILVTLTILSATVQEICPRMTQLVTVGALPFLHLHAPSHDTPTFFPSIRPLLDSPISPVLIGDFKCVQGPLDYAPGRHACAHCPALARILQECSYTDSFRSLYPTVSAARLDRAYLLPLLESNPRVARSTARDCWTGHSSLPCPSHSSKQPLLEIQF
jgi:hypothetical protein